MHVHVNVPAFARVRARTPELYVVRPGARIYHPLPPPIRTPNAKSEMCNILHETISRRRTIHSAAIHAIPSIHGGAHAPRARYLWRQTKLQRLSTHAAHSSDPSRTMCTASAAASSHNNPHTDQQPPKKNSHAKLCGSHDAY